MKVVNVGEFAKEKGCLGAWDEEYQSHELEEDALLDLLEEEVREWRKGSMRMRLEDGENGA